MPRRAPRAHITYDREVFEPEPSVEASELPWVIGVLAELGGPAQVPLKDRKFVEVYGGNFEHIRDEFVRGGGAEGAQPAWEGLRYLVSHAEASSGVKIRVLGVSKQELLEDFRAAGELERSGLFEQVYTEVYGARFAEPFGLLVGDYEFGHEEVDLELLGYLAEVGSAALAPFIAGAGPRMFGVRTFSELPGPGPLARMFEGEGLARWRGFRDRPEAAYVGLVLPRILLPGKGRRVWGNAAYALAARVAEAFRQYGWCAAIRGVEGGGLVADLRGLSEGGPVEAPIGEDQESVLQQLGFISLCHGKRTDRAVFFSAPSCRRPAAYQSEGATSAARLAARLPYVFAVSRFGHYLKVMMRDRSGAALSREACEGFLEAWISRYVMEEDEAGEEMKARYPLREGRVEVVDNPERPGELMAIAYLRPRFQLQDLGICQRVVTALPRGAAQE